MNRFFLRLLAGGLLVSGSSLSAAVLRFADYNITASGGSPRTGLNTILQAIGSESVGNRVQPLDLLMMEEIQSQSSTGQTVAGLLNSTYGGSNYAAATLNGSSTGAGTQGVVYNRSSLQLIAEKTVGTTSSTGPARQTLRYEFRPVGGTTTSDFFVYVSHWKSADDTADASRRNVEAQAIRADAAGLAAGAEIIYAGDYNVYRGSESSIQTMIAPGAGHANDPVNRIGSWHNNSSYADIDTQAPANTPPSGLTGGGLDDRFDFQLVSDSVLSGVGSLQYIPGSYHTFGNNGSVPLNGDINSSSNTALAGLSNRIEVLNDLTTVTDHLPVVADYDVTVPEPAAMTLGLALVLMTRRTARAA